MRYGYQGTAARSSCYLARLERPSVVGVISKMEGVQDDRLQRDTALHLIWVGDGAHEARGQAITAVSFGNP